MTDEARRVVGDYLDQVVCGRQPARSLVADPRLRRFASALRAGFPDLSVSNVVMISEGRFVGVHLAARGTHLGIFHGVPPTGRPWAATCSAIYRVQGGLIVDSWENWDLLGILEQIGGVQRAPTASA